MPFPSYLKILFKPKSILGLLVAVGLLFILFSGLSLSFSQPVADFFLHWGKIILIIGIVGWLLYIIPAVARNWGRLLGR
jgi:hypothetical protein